MVGSCAGLENPQTGELVLVAQVTMREPLTVPGGTQFMTDLAKWFTLGDGIAAIMGGRVVIVPQETYDLAQAGYFKATGKLPRPGWLQDAFLHPAQLLRSLGGDALETVRELVDAEFGSESIDVGPAIDELRKALVEISELAPDQDAALEAIALRIAAALKLLEDEPAPAPAEVAAESLALGDDGDQPALPAWPPRRMNFLQMADHALQERDLRELQGDGVETASEHLRNALQLMTALELESPGDRMRLRGIGRLLVDALVAIEPRRV